MTDVIPAAPGVAQSNREQFDAYAALLSDSPELFTMVETIAAPAAETTFDYLEVVGLNAAGQVVKASAVGGASRPVGICTTKIVVGAGVAGKKVAIYRGGHFNIDRLIFPAAYDDDAKKLAAFRGAPSPTQIVADVSKYHRKP